MKHFRLKSILFSIQILLLLLVIGCSDDDEGTAPGGTETFVMAIQTDQSTQGGFLVPLDSFPSGDYDLSTIPSNALQVSNARQVGFAFGNAIYYPTDPSGQQGIQKITPNSITGGLDVGGFISGAVHFGVISEEKGYYWDPDLGQTDIQLFDPGTMSRTGEIELGDVPEIANLREQKEGQFTSITFDQFMIERDGILFTQIEFIDGNNFSVYDSSFVVSIDIATDQVVDFTTLPVELLLTSFNFYTAGTSQITSNGDLYLGSVSITAGITRINAGETQFDQDYVISVSDFLGGTGFMISGPLVVGNTLYMKYFDGPLSPDFSNAADLVFRVFRTNVNNPSQPTLVEGIPPTTTSTLQTTGPFLYNDLAYFPVNNATFNGYYTLNPDTDEVRQAISAPGVVSQGILILREE